MPIYVFRCRRCDREFEERLTVAEREQATIACPECKGTAVVPVITGFFAKTSRKS
jgi:putative FmdB family regulatory protein